VKKKVDGQKKLKSEKKQKGESRYRKSTNGNVGRQKEKKKGSATGGQEKGGEEGCMERKVHIGNKCWKIITIYLE
jgi:hypothetical protein